jgi:PIN domain nuclease of toxin-antitoxin system
MRNRCQIKYWEIKFTITYREWYKLAQTHSGIVIEPLSPIDAIASTKLPGDFHKDPADRI